MPTAAAVSPLIVLFACRAPYEVLMMGIFRFMVHRFACVCRAGALSSAPSGTAGMDLRRWEVDPKHVILGERLAVGGFAEVFVGKYEVRRKYRLGLALRSHASSWGNGRERYS